MTDISSTLNDLDFLQENLDLSVLSPTEFEKLIFHLLDEMGFSNLNWRKGGDGNSATLSSKYLERFNNLFTSKTKWEKFQKRNTRLGLCNLWNTKV